MDTLNNTKQQDMDLNTATFGAYYDALDARLEAHGYASSPDPGQVREDYDKGLTLLESEQIWLNKWGEHFDGTSQNSVTS